MYQLNKDSITGQDKNCVTRLLDMASIPFDPDNTDYQEYLKFLAEGNEPLPAEEQQ
jgi:hypothetical protein